jgi:putative transposase
MARKVRIQSPGAIYHMMNRGDHREEIFRDDLDRHCFLETLEEACNKTSWPTY